MSEKQSRVRWNDLEKDTLASEMARLMHKAPSVQPLEALRTAQESLPEERRRDVKAWSVAEPMLGQRLEAALALLGDTAASSASQTTEQPGEPAGTAGRQEAETSADSVSPVLEQVHESPISQEGTAVQGQEETRGEALGVATVQAQPELEPAATRGQAPAAQSDRAEPAENVLAAAPTSTTSRGHSWDTLRVEAALVAALQSPAVEATLVELFGKAMSQAFSKMSSGSGGQVPTVAQAAQDPAEDSLRVLLAGFAAQQVKGLQDALQQFEVRTWKPGQGQPLFETLAGICNVAVIPESMSDDVDELLKSFDLKVLRHEGSSARLAERIVELAS